MPFSNPQLDTDGLPRLADTRLLPVSVRYARYRLLHALLSWVPLLLVLSLLPAEGPWPALFPLAAILALATIGPLYSALAWLEARRRAYALRAHDLVYCSGLLVRRTRILPVNRIQHVETVSGPLERLFGLVRLNCFTAGGSSGDLVLAGLDADTAGRIREYLLHRVQGEQPAESVSSDD